jgi:hypothetical protein
MTCTCIFFLTKTVKAKDVPLLCIATGGGGMKLMSGKNKEGN